MNIKVQCLTAHEHKGSQLMKIKLQSLTAHEPKVQCLTAH